MTRFWTAAALAAGLLMAGQASAQPAPGATGRVGVVNVREAIMGTAEGKRDLAALSARFDPKKAELKAMADQIDAMKKAPHPTPAQAKALQEKEREFQRRLQAAQGEFQGATQELVNRIGGKMMKLLDRFGPAHGYSVILDVSNPQTPVVWSAGEANVTKDLIAAYDAETPH